MINKKFIWQEVEVIKNMIKNKGEEPIYVFKNNGNIITISSKNSEVTFSMLFSEEVSKNTYFPPPYTGKVSGISYFEYNEDSICFEGDKLKFKNVSLLTDKNIKINMSVNTDSPYATSHMYIKNSDIETNRDFFCGNKIEFATDIKNSSYIKANNIAIGKVENIIIHTTNYYLVRHEKTDWKLGKLEDGPQDLPLNDEGRKNINKFNLPKFIYAETPKKIEIKNVTIITSTLKRCKETGQGIGEKCEPALKRIKTKTAFNEISYGTFTKEQADNLTAFLTQDSDKGEYNEGRARTLYGHEEFLPSDADDPKIYKENAGQYFINQFKKNIDKKNTPKHKINVISGCFREGVYETLLERAPKGNGLAKNFGSFERLELVERITNDNSIVHSFNSHDTQTVLIHNSKKLVT